MQKTSIVFAFVLLFALCGIAQASLDITLDELRVRASADFGDFRTEIGAQVGASSSQIDLAFRNIADPADAAVCLWLSMRSGQPVNVVIDQYRRHKNRGWGALAKSLGIKPGSAAFKNLKAGNLGWKSSPSPGPDRHPGKGKGKGKGKK